MGSVCLKAQLGETPLPNYLVRLLAGSNIWLFLASCWPEAPSAPCHMGLSVDQLMTWRLASIRESKQENERGKKEATAILEASLGSGIPSLLTYSVCPAHTQRERIIKVWSRGHWQMWETAYHGSVALMSFKTFTPRITWPQWVKNINCPLSLRCSE